MSLREVCLDTETTGFHPDEGDRVVEIACVELLDLVPSGRTWHCHLDPERDMPAGAEAIHGLSAEFLRGKPLFRDRVGEFLDFLGDDPVVAHNAPFDMRFLDAELALVNLPPLSNKVVDTLRLAKVRLGAGARASLDALCRRFDIDLSARIKHEAMIDTQLLAQVYQHLCGGPNRTFDLDAAGDTIVLGALPLRPDRGIGRALPLELERHAAFVASIRAKSGKVFWDTFTSE